MKNIKLVIWDFDGVIADTEKLYLDNRLKVLNDFYNLGWDFETVKHHIGGMSNLSAKDVLNQHGVATDNLFWLEVSKLDKKNIKSGFDLTPYIKKVLKKNKYRQCLATGGDFSGTKTKIKLGGLDSFFSRKNIFTAEMVKKGKPAPDLFLLAAEKMGAQPEECLVIEDSIPGLEAAIKAGMTPIAFVGADIHNTPQYKEKIQNMGINLIFDDMQEIYKIIC